MTPPAAIDTLAAIFQLSRFERELLLLCAGVEMDSTLAARCAEASGRSQRDAVTFSLAMAVLADPHWSALAPSAPLRRFRLIEIEAGPRPDGGAAAHRRAHPALPGRGQPAGPAARRRAVEPDPADMRWPRNIGSWRPKRSSPQPPTCSPATALHFCGDDASGQEDIAALIADRAGRQLFVLRLEDTPSGRRRDGSVCSVMDARGAACFRRCCCCNGRTTPRARPPASWPRDCRVR